MMVTDIKRSELKAFHLDWSEPPLAFLFGHWYGPPGAMIQRLEADGLIIACPGCGRLGTVRNGQNCQVVSGSFDDVTTLTLEPMISQNCCGWSGRLRDGMFDSV